MPEWIYKRDRSGNVRKRLLARGMASRPRGEDRPPRHMSETILKSYYAKECEDGSRFRSGYTKNAIKRVHEVALQRFDQLGVEA